MADDDGYFGERVAARYDESAEISGMFDPAVVEPVVDLLAELAGDGRAPGGPGSGLAGSLCRSHDAACRCTE